jgi:hypothetical protein
MDCVACDGGRYLAVFVSISASGAHKKKEKRTSYGTGVETGFYPVKYHDTCLIFRPFFVSGDFFSGLNQIDTPTGKQFEKKKQTTGLFLTASLSMLRSMQYPATFPTHVHLLLTSRLVS